MSMIDISNLTFSYPGRHELVFEDVSLRLDTDWRLGLVGRNGRGKTTLLKLLMGRLEYSGRILAPAEVDYFPFEIPDPGENALSLAGTLCPERPLWKFLRELDLLGVEDEALARPFETLSGGERTKILLALLFSGEERFTLIDEPTNHLDLDGRETVSAWLRKKKGFILVSHDRAFLDGCVDHILAINRSSLQVCQGDFSTWQTNKELRDAFELAESEKLKKDITRLEQAAARTEGWADKVEASKYGTLNSGIKPDRGYIGHKAAKMMKRSKAAQGRRQEAVQEKGKLLKNVESAEPLRMRPLSHHADRLVEAIDCSVNYGAAVLFEPVRFSLLKGQRLALSGPNGCGKSSVLKLAAGEGIPYTGRFSVAGGLVISYLLQDASFLRGGLTAFADESGIDESLFKTVLRKLDFERVQFEKDMAEFSAGQKKKVLLARSLCQSAHLYLWDEPLNYIDLYSRMQIEELISEFKPSMLLVEHDRAFLDAVATDVFELQPMK